MFGAICGDVLGAPYEVNTVTFKDFILLSDNCRLTDDTVCTVAVAEAILDGSLDFARSLKSRARSVRVAYGPMFEEWINSDREWQNSAGNGAVSRVAAIPWLAPDFMTTVEWAARSAMTSHRHPDSVAASIAIAAAARLGIEGKSKNVAMSAAAAMVGYDISVPLDEIRPGYGFRLLASETAPVAMRAVLEGTDFEDVLRLAISMGGDADTLAAAAGGIAEAFFPIPDEIGLHVSLRIPQAVKRVILDVQRRYLGIEQQIYEGHSIPEMRNAAMKWIEFARVQSATGNQGLAARGMSSALGFVKRFLT